MPRYRQKPPEVDAEQVTVAGKVAGTMAHVGDYIVTIRAEKYVVRKDVFEADYELCPSQPDALQHDARETQLEHELRMLDVMKTSFKKAFGE